MSPGRRLLACLAAAALVVAGLLAWLQWPLATGTPAAPSATGTPESSEPSGRDARIEALRAEIERERRRLREARSQQDHSRAELRELERSLEETRERVEQLRRELETDTATGS